MSTYFRIVRSRWFTSFFAVIVLGILVWVFGPVIGIGAMHPLETEVARWILIAAMLVLCLVSNLLAELKAGRRDKALANDIAGPEADAARAREEAGKAAAEEVALLRDRLRKATEALRRSKLGGSRKRLAAMPWYMIIGPPGAGKTTALQNCGLRFPLEEGKQPIRGVGGTRNCEWMFTDEAVLIDTAGRYTTQDSAQEVDSAGWLGFLDMLKRHRRRRPLNGILVAISLSDLASQTEAERHAHARAIRARVRELHERLGVRLPVYVLFTKADLIAGFSEFFDNLGKEEREQVWGMTFPLDPDGSDDEAGAVARFGQEFDLLLRRLDDRMLERVHQEPDIRRRRLIYGFPQQVASLREVAADFLTEAFQPSRLEARPLLRGVYLTSGTQEGSPIDRLLGTMAAEYGLPRQAVAAPHGPGKSYFLARLLRDVVFRESLLAGLDPKLERRLRWVSIGAWAACAVVLVGLGAMWLGSYVGNRGLIEQVHAGVLQYDARLAELQRRGPMDQDLAATLPALDALRGIRAGYNERDRSPPIELTFGLYQGEKLSRAAQDAYTTALGRILLPRLLSRVEARIAGNMANVDYLYQSLKVYLILGRQGPLDHDLVLQWMAVDLDGLYPGPEYEQTRAQILDHADAMLAQPLPAIALNDDLIAQARAVLNREPLADYSYNRLMRSKRITAIPVWSVAENAGPGASRVFEYRSKKPLDSGVPGIFTWPGYNNVLKPMLISVTQDLSEDSWVLGREKRGVQATIADTAKLRRDVLGLYLNDYIRRWDLFLADIAIRPTANLQEQADQLNLMTAPASPFRDLLVAIDAQTQLSRPAATDAAAQAAQARATAVGSRITGFARFQAQSGLGMRQNEVVNLLYDALGAPVPGGKPVDPASRVDEHFKELHLFVAGDGQQGKTPPLELTIQRMQQMYQSLIQAQNTGSGQGAALIGALSGGGGGGGGAAAQLQDLARQMPRSIAAMVSPVARNATQLAVSGAAAEMTQAWAAQVAPLCEAAFRRYPFVAGSRDDVPVDDFTRLLGPGGQMQTFFEKYLKPFVDSSTSPWKLAAPDRAPPNLTPATLAEFEKAQQIREGLFANGPQIQVKFALYPVSLDAQVGQVTIDIAGQGLTYAHGPQESQPFAWPGATGRTAVRVTMTPTGGGNGWTEEKDGPWALLRLLDGRTAPSPQPDKFRVTFSGAGGNAVFELQASSVRNPFTLTALRTFRCPAKL